MLRIRFLRTGKKYRPFFRIVATDSTNPPQGGRFKEKLGFFDPLKQEVKLKSERIKYWISVGAQPSDRVHNLLIKEGIIKGEKAAVHSKTKKRASEVEEGKKELKEVPKEKKEKEPKKEAPKEEINNEKEEAPKKEIDNEKKEAPKEIEKTEMKTETKKEQKKDLSQKKSEKKEE